MNRRPKLWLSIFALLMAIQISPWWYPKLDGCFYLSIARSIANGQQVTALGNPHLLTTLGYPILISPAFLAGDRPFLLLSILQCAMAIVCILGVYVWACRHFPSVAVLLTGLTMLNSSVWIHYRRTIKEIAFMTAVIWTVNAMHLLLKSKSPLRMTCLTTWVILLLTLCAMIRYPGIVLAAGFGISLLLAAYHGSSSWTRAVTLTLAVGIPPSASILWHIHYEERMAQIHGGDTYSKSFQEAVVKDLRKITQQTPAQVAALPKSDPPPQPAPENPIASDTKTIEDQIVVTTNQKAKVGSTQAGARHDPSGKEPPIATQLSVSSSREIQAAQSSEAGTVHSDMVVWHRLIEGVRLRISSLGRITLPGMFKAYSTRSKWLNLNMAIYMTWLIFLIVGWWYLCRRKRAVFAYSLPFYIILYILWPFDQGGRFLVPMSPLLMTCAWFGLRRLLPLRGFSMQFLAAFAMLHFVIAFAYWVKKDAPRAYVLHQQWPIVDRIAEKIQKNPQPVAIVNIDPKQQTKIRAMLELAIDRPVLEYQTYRQIDESVYWLVLPSGQPISDNFVVREQLDSLQLLSRTSTDALPIQQTASSSRFANPQTR